METLQKSFFEGEFPSELWSQENHQKIKIDYTFETLLQKKISDLFHQYRPDYGSFVALDTKTGKVLALVNYESAASSQTQARSPAASAKRASQDQAVPKNFSLRATFPSASVFKIVTAAAVLETQKKTPESLLASQGRKATLYRSQVFLPERSRAATRHQKWSTLKQAFAESNNPIFARLGVQDLGASVLSHYAHLFGFNRPLVSELPAQAGKAWIPEEDPWGIAESASGFTRKNTMSPLQGALIAATVAESGKLMRPYVINRLEVLPASENQPPVLIYEGQPSLAWQAILPETAQQLRELMQETVQRGTSRVAFRGFSQETARRVEVGGKTGSLSGKDPEGKYDWFVGYADDGSQKIALAVMTVHRHQWRVKSSYLARRGVETYYNIPAVVQKRPRKIRKKQKKKHWHTAAHQSN